MIKVKLTASYVNKADLRRAAIHLLQSMLTLPLHFANMQIKVRDYELKEPTDVFYSYPLFRVAFHNDTFKDIHDFSLKIVFFFNYGFSTKVTCGFFARKNDGEIERIKHLKCKIKLFQKAFLSFKKIITIELKIK